MMGKPMNDKQKSYIQQLINWNKEDLIDFKTFCGLCALCERLLAPEYCPQLPDRKTDPCHEVRRCQKPKLYTHLLILQVIFCKANLITWSFEPEKMCFFSFLFRSKPLTLKLSPVNYTVRKSALT